MPPSRPPASDPYAVLGLTPQASPAEIKAAYRALVKRHHPDAGGDDQRILALNAAWEALRDKVRGGAAAASLRDTPGSAGPPAPGPARSDRRRRASGDRLLSEWLQQVYAPIERLLGQVIDPFPAQLRALAADPYDDMLMEAFCTFLAQSQKRLEKVESLYRSRVCPASAQGFGLSVYHCLGQVQDALAELERYTMGYVDGYLHDGREMLREAGLRLQRLQEERRRLEL
ncbi:MAG: DnaJ domain-containing protein [Cyanobium sp.]